mgnify:CR=1 FL=1
MKSLQQKCVKFEYDIRYLTNMEKLKADSAKVDTVLGKLESLTMDTPSMDEFKKLEEKLDSNWIAFDSFKY